MISKKENAKRARSVMTSTRNAVETAIDLSRAGRKATWDGVAAKTQQGAKGASEYEGLPELPANSDK
jgi:hypothetical protein